MIYPKNLLDVRLLSGLKTHTAESLVLLIVAALYALLRGYALSQLGSGHS